MNFLKKIHRPTIGLRSEGRISRFVGEESRTMCETLLSLAGEGISSGINWVDDRRYLSFAVAAGLALAGLAMLAWTTYWVSQAEYIGAFALAVLAIVVVGGALVGGGAILVFVTMRLASRYLCPIRVRFD